MRRRCPHVTSADYGYLVSRTHLFSPFNGQEELIQNDLFPAELVYEACQDLKGEVTVARISVSRTATEGMAKKRA
jgi:hypothetical protein